MPLTALLVVLAAGAQQDPSASDPGRRHAVVVGVGELHADEARRIGAVLARCPGYAADRIEVLAGAIAEPGVSVESIRLALERLGRRAGAGDGALVVLLGASEVSGDELLIRVSPRDAFSLRWLGPTLEAMAAGEVALVLDVATPGSAHDASAHVERIAEALGVPVLCSCSRDETSHRSESGESLFRTSLATGLSGTADTDRDGSIDLGELFEHTGWDLTLWGLEHGATQTPRLVPESAGRVAVTGPVRRSTPAREPVPPPLPETERVEEPPAAPPAREAIATDDPPPPPSVARAPDDSPAADVRVDLERALGLNLGRVTAEIADFYELPRDRGAIVLGVTPGGPAERAGVEAFDILLTVDGIALESATRAPALAERGAVTLGLQRAWDRHEVQVFLAGERGPPTLGLLVRSTEPARGEPGMGVVVVAVQPGGPGDQAGLAVGDLLLSFDDVPLVSSTHLFELIAGVRPGRPVPFERVRVNRQGRERRTSGVLRPVARDDAGRLWAWASSVELAWGLRLRPLEDGRAAELGLSPGAGLRVAFVHRPGPADDAWLEVGDVLLRIDGREARALESLVERPRPDVVILEVLRNDRTHTVDMRRNP